MVSNFIQVLSSEFESRQLTISEKLPKNGFGGRLILSEFA